MAHRFVTLRLYYNISLLNGSKGRAQEGRLVQLRLTAVDSRRNRSFNSDDFLIASQIPGFCLEEAAVDSRRNRSFNSDDFLIASQIPGFSSRLASKKTLPGEGDHLEALVGTADFVLPIV